MPTINFVRKIKLAVVHPTKEGKNAGYEKLRTIQYHVWKLANKIVQGQYVLKVLPHVILFKYPEDYTRFKSFEGKLTTLKALKGAQRTAAVKEEVKQLYIEQQAITERHRTEFDEYLRTQSIRNYTYSSNADEYYDLIPSNIRTSINAKVFADFNNRYKEFQVGSASIQSYKRTIPVPFQTNAIINLRTTPEEDIMFKMFGVDLICLLGKDRNNTKYILQDLISNGGQFKMNDSSYQFKDGEFFLLLNLETEETKTKKNVHIVAGIDLGVTRMATLVIKNLTDKSPTTFIERKFYGDNTFMKKVMYHKTKRSNLNRFALGKTGKGRLHAIGKKTATFKKHENFRDNFNKKLAHHIIQRCTANQVSLITMEDLSGINNIDQFLKDWPYFDLQTKIENKAKEYGIEVRYIPPAYTSQTCPSCGNVHADNRKSQAEFECVKCHYKNNADVVGALNIATMNRTPITVLPVLEIDQVV